MDMDTYQQLAKGTQKDTSTGLTYLTLGLVSEAGEVADKLKKAIRDTNGEVDPLGLMKELGDCLWYISMLANYYNHTLSEVANLNIDKLESRAQRNKLSGSGDDR